MTATLGIDDSPSREKASTARVSFRQPVSSVGFVDGGWWPRSRDLAAELPALMDVLWTASRDITRISYHLGFWQPVGRRLLIEGRAVRLGGFTMQSELLLSLRDSFGRERIDLLVIPPETDPAIAGRALALASVTAGVQRPEQLLEQAAQPS